MLAAKLSRRYSNRMRIIYVTATFPYGPTEVFAVPELSELQNRGHELKIVPITVRSKEIHKKAEPFLDITAYEALASPKLVAAASGEFMRSGFAASKAFGETLKGQTRRVMQKNAGMYAKGLWLAKLARAWQADHIHAYWASVAATTAMIAAEATHLPWSFSAHRWDIERPNALSAKLKSASFARFISQDGLELARHNAQLGSELDEKATVIHMGVPLTATAMTPKARPAGVDLRVICTGSLVLRKGQRFLLEAVGALKQEHGYTVHVALAGDGPRKDDLRQQAQELGISEQLTLLGNVDHTALLDSYSAGNYDAFVLPSEHEGLSVALIEAMSRGLPAIATDVGGTRELLTAGSGHLIPSRDVEALKTSLLDFIENPEKREQMAQTGKARVIQNHDIVRVVDAMESKFLAAKIPQRP